MLANILAFLHDPANRAVLSWIGGGIVVVICGRPMASWQALFGASNYLVGCGHMSGLCLCGTDVRGP